MALLVSCLVRRFDGEKVTLGIKEADTDLTERNTTAQGTDVSIMNSFHSPPVAQAIIGITHIPDVQPTNCSIAMRALCEADDISIPAIQFTEVILW
jgi:hypothetical protein